ncbi:MAG: adenylosuccinate synthase [Sphingobacteriales bacterium]|jgi:adenylosuccinate synthase
MPVDVLLGLQWGDEGKGKIVDVLSTKYDVIARFQGGPNAGHTLEFEGQKHVLNTIPSGIFCKGVINLIGNGVVIDPITLEKEIEKLEPFGVDPYTSGNLIVSKKAHLIIPTHKFLDAASEAIMGDKKIGSTLRGISPTYQDKMGRKGLRAGDTILPNFHELYTTLKERHLKMLDQLNFDYSDLEKEEKKWFSAIENLKKLKLVEGEFFINEQLAAGKSVLAEGAQGTLLDIDFGSYPYVTSSNTVTAGACTGLGIPPSSIKNVIGIFKAYCTRVGSGPFPSELEDAVGIKLGEKGHEFGATTGRKRRCGWIDIPALKYAIMLNGVTELVMTKADVLSGFENIAACVGYNQLGKEIYHFPSNLAQTDVEPIFQSITGWEEELTEMRTTEELPATVIDYINYLEKELDTEINYLSVGPDREQMIDLKK